ncbi:MAG: hypothetical protein AB1765_08635 [Candidatus Hydrogenedentota bacterium]
MSKIKFIDLNKQYLLLRDEIIDKIDVVCRKSAFCLGEYVEEFERNEEDVVTVTNTIKKYLEG